MNESKRGLRREMAAILGKLTIHERKEKSLRLSHHILQFLNTSFAAVKTGIMGGFVPLEDEPLWHLKVKDWIMAFPKKTNEGMGFFQATLDELIPSKDFGGIRIPPRNAPSTRPDLLLIPGMAFDKTGGRLGRGGGLYDRYLQHFDGMKVGVCFNLQLRDQVPLSPHDQLVDLLITEKGIVHTTREDI